MRDPPKILTDEEIERLMRPARIPPAWTAKASEERRAAKAAADKFLRAAETNDITGLSVAACSADSGPKEIGGAALGAFLGNHIGAALGHDPRPSPPPCNAARS
jgi:hypothetical protein